MWGFINLKKLTLLFLSKIFLNLNSCLLQNSLGCLSYLVTQIRQGIQRQINFFCYFQLSGKSNQIGSNVFLKCTAAYNIFFYCLNVLVSSTPPHHPQLSSLDMGLTIFFTWKEKLFISLAFLKRLFSFINALILIVSFYMLIWDLLSLFGQGFKLHNYVTDLREISFFLIYIFQLSTKLPTQDFFHYIPQFFLRCRGSGMALVGVK